MVCIAYVFLKLWSVKVVVTKRSKKPRFRTPPDSQHAKQSQTLISKTAFLLYFSITLRKMEFENVSLSDIWNIGTLFQHIDCR